MLFRAGTGAEQRRLLAPRNLVLNASAVVWRTEALRKTFAALGDEAYRFRCAGDWRIYVEACRLGGAVAYVAEPLNHHRRHGASVTHALDKPTHFEEVRRVLDVVVGDLADDTNIRAEVSRYLRDLQAAWKLGGRVPSAGRLHARSSRRRRRSELNLLEL